MLGLNQLLWLLAIILATQNAQANDVQCLTKRSHTSSSGAGSSSGYTRESFPPEEYNLYEDPDSSSLGRHFRKDLDPGKEPCDEEEIAGVEDITDQLGKLARLSWRPWYEKHTGDGDIYDNDYSLPTLDPADFMNLILEAVPLAIRDAEYESENINFINPHISAWLTEAEASITRDPELLARVTEYYDDKTRFQLEMQKKQGKRLIASNPWRELAGQPVNARMQFLIEKAGDRLNTKDAKVLELWDTGRSPYLAMKQVEKNLIKFYEAYKAQRMKLMMLHGANAIAWHKRAKEMRMQNILENGPDQYGRLGY